MTFVRNRAGGTLAAAILSAAVLPAGAALAQEAELLSANLFGEEVVGDGGGKAASGDFNAEADPETGKLCYYFGVAGVDDATEAHIHEGAKGKTGPAVLTLPLSPDDEHCVSVGAELLTRLADKPGDFYIDVHSASHPDGAARGQLRS